MPRASCIKELLFACNVKKCSAPNTSWFKATVESFLACFCVWKYIQTSLDYLIADPAIQRLDNKEWWQWRKNNIAQVYFPGLLKSGRERANWKRFEKQWFLWFLIFSVMGFSQESHVWRSLYEHQKCERFENLALKKYGIREKVQSGPGGHGTVRRAFLTLLFVVSTKIVRLWSCWACTMRSQLLQNSVWHVAQVTESGSSFPAN